MLVEVTYACKMGCTHCLSDCKPDGEHMTLEVFEDVLKFMIKNQIPTWSFSGGEMFEHPDILKMLSLIESYWKTLPIKYPITFATNGRELVRNKKIYHAVSEFLKHCGKRYVMIQVTDDPRFYPDPLTDNEKYLLGGVVFCYCGWKLYGTTLRNNQYYVCSNKKICRCKMKRADVLEKEVIKKIEDDASSLLVACGLALRSFD